MADDTPPEPQQRAWLAAHDVLHLVPPDQVERAYLAFSRCPFREGVTQEQKTRFFIKLVPYVDHLAVKSTDLGRFKDEKYVYHIRLTNSTPIVQPPM